MIKNQKKLLNYLFIIIFLPLFTISLIYLIYNSYSINEENQNFKNYVHNIPILLEDKNSLQLINNKLEKLNKSITTEEKVIQINILTEQKTKSTAEIEILEEIKDFKTIKEIESKINTLKIDKNSISTQIETLEKKLTAEEQGAQIKNLIDSKTKLTAEIEILEEIKDLEKNQIENKIKKLTKNLNDLKTKINFLILPNKDRIKHFNDLKKLRNKKILEKEFLSFNLIEKNNQIKDLREQKTKLEYQIDILKDNQLDTTSIKKIFESKKILEKLNFVTESKIKFLNSQDQEEQLIKLKQQQTDLEHQIAILNESDLKDILTIEEIKSKINELTDLQKEKNIKQTDEKKFETQINFLKSIKDELKNNNNKETIKSELEIKQKDLNFKIINFEELLALKDEDVKKYLKNELENNHHKFNIQIEFLKLHQNNNLIDEENKETTKYELEEEKNYLDFQILKFEELLVLTDASEKKSNKNILAQNLQELTEKMYLFKSLKDLNETEANSKKTQFEFENNKIEIQLSILEENKNLDPKDREKIKYNLEENKKIKEISLKELNNQTINLTKFIKNEQKKKLQENELILKFKIEFLKKNTTLDQLNREKIKINLVKKNNNLSEQIKYLKDLKTLTSMEKENKVFELESDKKILKSKINTTETKLQ
ncbi:hypothetical protein ATP_00056 [Candidatus Phytoplasma mali]|uniref:Uncharacterized protein n=1 Tax=Phytoplasma mali (strain AT) TaxID=482235 RepID=B3R079_PHYMT|nr:hypothetical protein [Candidatus Phytoplasma mali]CAP18243.1 hypothetical protein ATP_00056 [Candidatus Phytoplasma mali]